MTSLARAIVACYPRAWRERYAQEVLEILDAGSVRLRDVCDLLRGCLSERVLALYEPSRHITAFRWISGLSLTLYLTALLVGLLLVAAAPLALGFAVHYVFGPFPAEWTDRLAWAFGLVFLLTIVPVWIQLFRLEKRSSQPTESVSRRIRRLRMTVAAAYGLLIFLVGVEGRLSFQAPAMLALLIMMFRDEPPGQKPWPGSGMFEALARLRTAQHDLRWARMELARCEGLYEGRSPGPELRVARVEMARLTTEEAAAMAALEDMGYHARFQR